MFKIFSSLMLASDSGSDEKELFLLVEWPRDSDESLGKLPNFVDFKQSGVSEDRVWLLKSLSFGPIKELIRFLLELLRRCFLKAKLSLLLHLKYSGGLVIYEKRGKSEQTMIFSNKMRKY